MLNIDLDHTDYFTGGLEQIKESFRKYALLAFAQEDPLVISNADDENTVRALFGVEKTTFGIVEDADFRAVNITYNDGCAEFDIAKKGEFFCHVALSVPGGHNVYNALATAAACCHADVAPYDIGKYLSDFVGLSRRFERKGSVNGAQIYIDYAHHPKELVSAISAARKVARGRVLCVFEPHTYSRTASLFSDFAASFNESDKTFFVDIYAAREVNTYGVSSEQLAMATPRCEYTPTYEDVAKRIHEEAKDGDIVLVLGAGTVDKVATLIAN